MAFLETPPFVMAFRFATWEYTGETVGLRFKSRELATKEQQQHQQRQKSLNFVAVE